MRRFVRSRINVEVSFQSTDDTCRRVLGRCDRGAVPSDLRINVKHILASFSSSFKLFFVGVSRFAEGNLGPPPLEGYVSSDSVLHRLAAELYSIVCPALSTWEAVRSRMAANETEWSLPLSEELPEGLSDESPGRVTRENSSEAAPSTSGTRQSGWVDRIRRRYQIPDDVVLRIPDSDERACCPKYVGDVAFYEADLKAGLRFPMQPFVRELLDFPRFGAGAGEPEWLADDHSLHGYVEGFWTFKNRDANSRVVQGLPTSDRIWKDKYFFVCGDNWERLPQEDPRDFVGVRSAGSSSTELGLARADLEDIGNRGPEDTISTLSRIFLPPSPLVPSPAPRSKPCRELTRNVGFSRVNTMKLNKSRLKQMAQSGEVAAAPISLKRKKPDEGSSRRSEEALPRPSVPIVTPPVVPTAAPSVQKAPTVIMVDSDLTPPSAGSTINQSPLVAMDRAKGAITPQDTDEYAVAHTDDLSLLMVHSLMRGLTEAVVMARRCASVEEDLALLRAKSIADEAEMKNVKRAVMELTRERKEALIEAENLRKELKAREDDTKAAVEAKDKAEADFKHLFGQIEGAKEAAVSDFRASEAFEDINTRYFLSGFEAFRKQAVQRFPGLDFSALQPYDDEDSVMDASQDQAGDEDVTSK
uniref:Uncharacterized protein n=1 Tax=Fagus sylvatica TaxID=28930 RepID=A0A2N9H4B1_FAGSY